MSNILIYLVLKVRYLKNDHAIRILEHKKFLQKLHVITILVIR